MPLSLPRLPAGQRLVDEGGMPSLAFTVYWQQVLEALEAQEATQEQIIADLATLVGEQGTLLAAIVAAQAAADAANAAAVAADTAVVAATESQALSASYVSGATVSATDAGTDATITISGHTRHYPQPDGTTVDVSMTGASLTARAYSTKYWIYYDDPARAGGAVAYQSSTTEIAQIGDRHVVGSVTTPAALATPTSGGTVRPPGSGAIQ